MLPRAICKMDCFYVINCYWLLLADPGVQPVIASFAARDSQPTMTQAKKINHPPITLEAQRWGSAVRCWTLTPPTQQQAGAFWTP
jgi:hypothetical protein